MFKRLFYVDLTKTAPGEIPEVPLLVSWFHCNRAPREEYLPVSRDKKSERRHDSEVL
jgi:hypothetical protein